MKVKTFDDIETLMDGMYGSCWIRWHIVPCVQGPWVIHICVASWMMGMTAQTMDTDNFLTVKLKRTEGLGMSDPTASLNTLLQAEYSLPTFLCLSFDSLSNLVDYEFIFDIIYKCE